MVGKFPRRIFQTTRDYFFVNDNGFRNRGLTAWRKRGIGVGGREAGEEDVWGLWGQAPRRDTEGEPPKWGGGNCWRRATSFQGPPARLLLQFVGSGVGTELEGFLRNAFRILIHLPD